ncbi:unnamed protein product [Eruca vesicaria subsp. sativa]|uniref:Uncharacterized protein n=1 Tax=Eruca vesicaria subsp. sativa TaxID=29727 RepID=A0ABC8KBV3_ERUVS|nr:unnamed protein product [Eruca vesicaria subsp. sativa]
MLSPQTPRNKRRLVLGLDLLKTQVLDTPQLSSCLTSLSRDLHKTSFNSITTKTSNQRRSTSQGSTRTVLKDITNTVHSRKTNLQLPPSTLNESTKDIDEDGDIVGTDLFGGIVDIDEVQVFDCSSQEDSDSENDETDVDDPMDTEPDHVLNITTDSAQKQQPAHVFVKSSKPSMNHFSHSDGND